MHQKHTNITKPELGEFARNELAILGTPCGAIQKLASKLVEKLSASWKIAYVDADHRSADLEQEHGADSDSTIAFGAGLAFTDKISFRRLDVKQEFNPYQNRQLFNAQDLVLVNGNHFKAKSQIVVIDPAKPLDLKLEKLTDVRLLILRDSSTPVPDYLRQHLPDLEQLPVYTLEQENEIAAFILAFLDQQVPKLKGLVLAGGQSTRMQQDKGSLAYHGVDQREHVRTLLATCSEQVYISCNQQQRDTLENPNTILEDKFIGIGPMGGILSAMQQDPNSAWLTLACDLPYLSEHTLQYLVQHRNPSKLATAFLDPDGKFPEPLLTIWEPRAYQVLLSFLAQGYTCPRKVLINADVELLQAPDVQELRNVNYPEEYQEVMRDIQNSKTKI
ncbi:NTP transferase domain-containing protein [uncultured Pontibacter sp.]|uniref:NTP transferase domain-containing protein n=1 Tax=uncultured Pontibacter sp. TaxID=453356 RepID=UPI00261FA41B|nr:NTP transferase domain-containing protein [uncultured Pontibacter sp.]